MLAAHISCPQPCLLLLQYRNNLLFVELAALHLIVTMDLLRKSGEFPMKDEELDDGTETIYDGV